jgi:hypothetical protein
MRILAALALLVSTSAFACPELSGSYTCTYQDGSNEVINISQENKDGVIVYYYNGSAIPADNQAYPIPDDDNLKSGTFRAWCDEQNSGALNAQVLGKYYQQGQYYGDLTLNMAYMLDGQNLKENVTGSLKGAAGEQPIDSSMVCTRNP